MTKKALIIGSNGSEEIELLVTSDVLRRAGVEVTIAGLQDEKTIVCAHNASLNVDKLFKNVLNDTFDAVILPGGQPGSDNLANDNRVGELLRRHDVSGKIVAAICAAPIALKNHKVSPGATVTSYPCFADKFDGYNYVDSKVAVSRNIVTSRGPGTSFDFALKLAELLTGEESALAVKKSLLL